MEANLSGEAITTMKIGLAMAMARERVLYQTFLAQLAQQSLMSICRLMERKNQLKPLKDSSAILVEKRSEEKHLFAPCLLLT